MFSFILLIEAFPKIGEKILLRPEYFLPFCDEAVSEAVSRYYGLQLITQSNDRDMELRNQFTDTTQFHTEGMISKLN